MGERRIPLRPAKTPWAKRNSRGVNPLISVDQLAAAAGDTRIFDIRWDLTSPKKGRKTYQAGHIPGAVFVDLEEDLSAHREGEGRHPLPDIDDFAVTLGELGITPGTHVVVYDDVSGRIAARMWWMLRALGHQQVQVLDGGYQAWIAAGHDVGVGSVKPETTDPYPVPEAFHGVVAREELHDRALLDARTEERYRGEVEPVDPKAGHIPGAINIPTHLNLAEDGHFLPGETLASLYSHLPKDTVVSCGSGVTACHDALAMVIAGREMPEVYVGSFSEWSRLDLPVATGPNP
jgi:thiosulfate/3-mercaptopyruvate sulfurtransferase